MEVSQKSISETVWDVPKKEGQLGSIEQLSFVEGKNFANWAKVKIDMEEQAKVQKYAANDLVLLHSCPLPLMPLTSDMRARGARVTIVSEQMQSSNFEKLESWNSCLIQA